MLINPKIFKEYDIRGIYPTEINGQVAYAVARAFVKFIVKTHGTEHPRLILSRDVRISSPEISSEVSRALVDEGALVIDTGITTSPMHCWIVGHESADGGIMVTASHNPKEHNGFKLTGKGVYSIGAEDGLREIGDLAAKPAAEPQSEGSVEKKNYASAYTDAVVKGFSFSPMNIAVDTSNGAAGFILTSIFLHFPNIMVKALAPQPDGNFPNHGPDPQKEDAARDISRAIINDQLDLGAIFDADGDQIFFIDEQGAKLGGDVTTAIFASYILKSPQGRGASIVYDASSSRIVKETIEASGGKAVLSRTGHTFVKRAMREHSALFGGEHSGHYYFRDSYGFEDTILAMLMMMDIRSKEGQPLSKLASPFRKYFRSEEINFPFRDWSTVENIVKKEFEGVKTDSIDGLTIELPDWRFNLRPSNTEPLIRLNVEAASPEKLRECTARLENLIKAS